MLVETNTKKILFDPWLIGNAYYGSWSIYPNLNLDFNIFNDIDYIHISHIHPDHLHDQTLKLLPNVPVLIHNWTDKFVKRKIESLGKNVIELDHGVPFIDGDLSLEVYAADGCNPQACFNFFGCGKLTPPGASYGIDTFSLITDGSYRIAQINDCPYELAKTSLDKILPVDLLLVGYTGASSYPQCWYDEGEILNRKINKKRQHFLDMGLKYIKHLKPKYYSPYAGTYVLSGKNNYLNKYKGSLSRSDALSFYQENVSYKGFILSAKQSFDLNNPVLPTHSCNEDYIEEFLESSKNTKYEYEYDENVKDIDLIDLAKKSYSNYLKKAAELQYNSNTDIFIYLNENILKFSKEKLELVKSIDSSNYVSYSMDTRLLKRILMGPKYGHFNNADIGSHIKFRREPDVYDRKLYYLMNFFHV